MIKKLSLQDVKPCPFCGQLPRLIVKDSFIDDETKEHEIVTLGCVLSFCTTNPKVKGNWLKNEFDLPHLIYLWNKRTIIQESKNEKK